MKYVRTEDGIINYDRAIHNIKFWCSEHCYNYYFTRKELKRFEESIKNCKQADTIKELCDEFVIIRKDDVSMGGELKTLKEMLLQRDCDIEFEVEDDYFYYGAIWTDKGLIYVAKMKGILPNGEIDWELL